MSVAAVLGPQSLTQLGISLSDVAQIFRIGQKVGNWLMAKRNDEDLFETLMEDPDALLRRKGIVEPTRMESMFPDTQFIYRGDKITTSNKDAKLQHGELGPFSWLMVVIVSAIDHCLLKSKVTDMLVLVFKTYLNNPEAESALRVNLSVNIESWRSVGQVRNVSKRSLAKFRNVWKEKTGADAISELNWAEKQEMSEFLICLMGNTSSNFTCFSVATYSVAKALEGCKVFISTADKRDFEGQLLVEYVPDCFDPGHWAKAERNARQSYRAIESRAQIVSFPSGNPASMVQTARAKRKTINQMKHLWSLGSKTAENMSFICTVEYPYSADKEVQYGLGEDMDPDTEDFDSYILVLAGKAFPHTDQGILSGLEKLVEGCNNRSKAWLESHAGLEYLFKSQLDAPDGDEQMVELWLSYQALVFGFYYKPFEPLISYELVANSSSYYCGLWGHGSTTFLAMCSQFGRELKRNRTVGRTHVLHMLATMYAGRNKAFYPDRSRTNLVGVLGSISILTKPLLRTSDDPNEMGKFVILDLPVVHLAPNEEGELYAAVGHSMNSQSCNAEKRSVQPRGPGKKWTVHSSMSTAFREGSHAVVMAARCGERLVG